MDTYGDTSAHTLGVWDWMSVSQLLSHTGNSKKARAKCPQMICQDIHGLYKWHFLNNVKVCRKWPCVSLLQTQARYCMQACKSPHVPKWVVSKFLWDNHLKQTNKQTHNVHGLETVFWWLVVNQQLLKHTQHVTLFFVPFIQYSMPRGHSHVRDVWVCVTLTTTYEAPLPLQRPIFLHLSVFQKFSICPFLSDFGNISAPNTLIVTKNCSQDPSFFKNKSVVDPILGNPWGIYKKRSECPPPFKVTCSILTVLTSLQNSFPLSCWRIRGNPTTLKTNLTRQSAVSWPDFVFCGQRKWNFVKLSM